MAELPTQSPNTPPNKPPVHATASHENTDTVEALANSNIGRLPMGHSRRTIRRALDDSPAPGLEALEAKIASQNVALIINPSNVLEMDKLCLAEASPRSQRQHLETLYKERLPHVQAASRNLQNALEIYNGEQWPIPPLPPSWTVSQKQVERCGAVLRGALNECEDVRLDMNRKSEKLEYLDLNIKMTDRDTAIHEKILGNEISSADMEAKIAASAGDDAKAEGDVMKTFKIDESSSGATNSGITTSAGESSTITESGGVSLSVMNTDSQDQESSVEDTVTSSGATDVSKTSSQLQFLRMLESYEETPPYKPSSIYTGTPYGDEMPENDEDMSTGVADTSEVDPESSSVIPESSPIADSNIISSSLAPVDPEFTPATSSTPAYEPPSVSDNIDEESAEAPKNVKGKYTYYPVPNPIDMPDSFTHAICHQSMLAAQPILTLTLTDTTRAIKTPTQSRSVLLLHFEVGLDGVEAIIHGQFKVAENKAWIKNVREKRLGKLGEKKDGTGGWSKELAEAAIKRGHGQGWWLFFGIRFQQSGKERKKGRGGKWACFGAPIEAVTSMIHDDETVTLGGGVNQNGDIVPPFQARAKRIVSKYSKGGISCMDLWQGANTWEHGVWAEVQNAMAHGSLLVSFLYQNAAMKAENVAHQGRFDGHPDEVDFSIDVGQNAAGEENADLKAAMAMELEARVPKEKGKFEVLKEDKGKGGAKRSSVMAGLENVDGSTPTGGNDTPGGEGKAKNKNKKKKKKARKLDGNGVEEWVDGGGAERGERMSVEDVKRLEERVRLIFGTDLGGELVKPGVVEAGAVESGAVEPGAVASGIVETGAMEAGAVDAWAVEIGAVASGPIESGAMEVEVSETGTGGVKIGPAEENAGGVEAEVEEEVGKEGSVGDDE